MEVDRIKSACSETLVISLLRDRPMHGYEMGKEIERRSAEYFSLKYGTLYPILHRLEKEGLVKGKWVAMNKGKPKKQYKLTRRGASHYLVTADKWRELFSSLVALVPEVAR